MGSLREHLYSLSSLNILGQFHLILSNVPQNLWNYESTILSETFERYFWLFSLNTGNKASFVLLNIWRRLFSQSILINVLAVCTEYL